MTDRQEPFDLLAALNPIDGRPLRAGDDPVADATLARVVADSTLTRGAGSGRLTRRRRLAVPIVVAGLLVSGGAAAAWYATRGQDESLFLTCFRTDDPASEQALMVLARGGDPVDACASAWRDGTFGSEGPPMLTWCINATGDAAVVPGSADACNVLGFAPGPPTQDPEAEAIRAANAAFAALIDADADGCVGRGTVLRDVRSIADEHGLAEWSIRSGPALASLPCMTVAFDRDTRTIVLVGIPAFS